MLAKREFIASAVLFVAAAARAQTPHWLIGTWHGQIIGFPAENRRVLIVRTVADDGTVDASWVDPVVGTLRDGELTFRSGADSSISLRQSGPNTLEGFFATRNARRRYSVVMQRR